MVRLTIDMTAGVLVIVDLAGVYRGGIKPQPFVCDSTFSSKFPLCDVRVLRASCAVVTGIINAVAGAVVLWHRRLYIYLLFI